MVPDFFHTSFGSARSELRLENLDAFHDVVDQSGAGNLAAIEVYLATEGEHGISDPEHLIADFYFADGKADPGN